MKKPLRTLRANKSDSNLPNRIVGITKSLHKTIESKFNTLIYRLLDLSEAVCLNAEFQTPSPSLSSENIDKLLFEIQETNLAVEAQIKSLNVEIEDFRRMIEECAQRCDVQKKINQ